MNAFLKSKSLSVLKYPCFKTSKRCIFWRRKTKKNENPYLIMRAKKTDRCCILDLLWHHYYPEEPTTSSIGLGCKYNPVFDEQALKDMAEGLTLVAKCKYSGEIVGASINKTACSWDPDALERWTCSLSCPKTRQLYRFYAYLQRFPCLWQKYEAPKIFEISQLVVRRQDRGRGVATLLTQASRTLGADSGYRVVRMDCTNFYSGKICEHLKMFMACEIPYCSYTEEGPTNDPVFSPPAPHLSCKIYIDVPPYEYKK